jgi:hypothetical protein
MTGVMSLDVRMHATVPPGLGGAGCPVRSIARVPAPARAGHGRHQPHPFRFLDGVGVILVGLPGIEKRLARYPQLFSRVGFVHHVRPLSEEELRFILAHKWQEVGLTFSPDDYTDAEALAAIARITGGNVRLVQRLFAQIARGLEINRLRTISKEVVDTAREHLVIGL